MKVILVEVFDKEGNLLKIEVTDSSGKFIIQSLWDPNDEQTHDNRVAFRKWTYEHLRKLGHEVD
jgi:hypothetical protein